jgi:hypothetical protein
MIASVSITTFVFLKTQTQTLSSGPTKGQILYQSNTFIVPIANLACSFVSELSPSPPQKTHHTKAGQQRGSEQNTLSIQPLEVIYNNEGTPSNPLNAGTDGGQSSTPRGESPTASSAPPTTSRAQSFSSWPRLHPLESSARFIPRNR